MYGSFCFFEGQIRDGKFNFIPLITEVDGYHGNRNNYFMKVTGEIVSGAEENGIVIVVMTIHGYSLGEFLICCLIGMLVIAMSGISIVWYILGVIVFGLQMLIRLEFQSKRVVEMLEKLLDVNE